MEEKPMNVEERIQAFYRQSGGPLNERIPELIERHLLYGKDHGPPGRRETLEDAFMRWVFGERSVRLVAEYLLRRRAQAQGLEARLARLEKEIAELKGEVRVLKERLAPARGELG